MRGKNDDPDKPSSKRKKTEEQDLNDSKCKETTLKKIIFIDSTWNQTNKIFTDERLQGKKKKLFLYFFAPHNFHFRKLHIYRHIRRIALTTHTSFTTFALFLFSVLCVLYKIHIFWLNLLKEGCRLYTSSLNVCMYPLRIIA